MDRHRDRYCALSIVHFLAFPECQAGDGPILETTGGIAPMGRLRDASTSKRNLGGYPGEHQAHLARSLGAAINPEHLRKLNATL